MPSTPRKRSPSPPPAPAAEPATATPTATTPATAAPSTRTDGHGGHPLVALITFPVTAARAVAEDVVSAARRPDAIAYWGGLAGLAALGILDWPVAAAVGIGVAVANGVRRSRA